MYNYDVFPDPDDSFNNIRTIELENNKLHIIRTEPFGFWRVKFERGVLPASLSGLFTSPYEAGRAVDLYLKTKKKKVVE